MDDRLKAALDYSNYVITLNHQKRIILEKYKEALIYYFNGGKFTITQQLISFCKTLVDMEQDSFVLVDDDGTPVNIQNLKKFLFDALNIMVTASNSYLMEYQKLSKQRSVQGIVDL